MKYHFAIKFIAIVLCALSLLGAATCGLSVFALTDMNLYHKDVDQVYQEQVQEYGHTLAHDRAMFYASNTLGGCPEPMVQQMHGISTDAFNPAFYGYALKDADGNVLESVAAPAGDNIITYTFDVSGQYMHLVDILSADQPQETEEETVVVSDPLAASEVLAASAVSVSRIPSQGAVLEQITLTFKDSSVGLAGENLGTVFRNADGLVVVRTTNWDMDPENTEIYAIALHDSQGNLIYEAANETGIGIVAEAADGTADVIFTSYPMAKLTDAADPAEPAVTEATEETAPQATEAEETTPATEETKAADSDEDEAESTEETKDKDSEEKKSDSEEGESEKKSKKESEEDSEKKSEKDSDEDSEKKSKKDSDEDSEKKSEKDSDEDSEKKSEKDSDEDSEKKSKKDSDEDSEKKSDEDSEKKSEKESEKDSDKESKDADESAASEGDSEDAEAASEDAAASTEETAAPTVPETLPAETLPAETVPVETIPEPVLINGRPLNTYQINRCEYTDAAIGQTVIGRYVYIPMPEMTMELYVAPGALATDSGYIALRLIREIRSYLLPAMGIFLLLFAVCMVYLVYAAAHSSKSSEIRPGALNRIPLDLYGLLAAGSLSASYLLILEGGDYLLRQSVSVGCTYCITIGYLVSLLIVGFFFACAAQFKAPDHFWWHNSLCGLFLKLCIRLMKKLGQLCVRLEAWTAATGWPRLRQKLGRLWDRVCSLARRIITFLTRLLDGIHQSIHRFLSLLPITWQWILIGCVILFALFFSISSRNGIGFVLALLVSLGLILYGAHCFGELMDATRRMSKGNLDCKIPNRKMVGSFLEFSGYLKDLANVAVVAAQKQLKSERTKTELIANVSHDIRTPLTSIINYVDLLQMPHSQEDEAQYLEVLDRQSQRLKKLLDDLIDMSKASTGNMVVDIAAVDAVEFVNQALGEFADKLDSAQLIPVFRHTEDSVAMLADGKLVWRVLSNLLSNAVKYAMPCTRLYIDLMTLDNQVVISLKNISRDPLNVDADELMERFVRGDDSRNTDGSGLGLNIAKSLMELQKGQLQLLVDGDLFKVTLIFPGI